MARVTIPLPTRHGSELDGPQLLNWWPVPSVSGRSERSMRTVKGGTVTTATSALNGIGGRGSFISGTGPLSRGYQSSRYACFGDSVFRVTPANALVKIGNFNFINSSTVSWCENQAQGESDVNIYVCDGAAIYRFDAKAEDADLPASWEEVSNLPRTAEDGDQYAHPVYLTWSDYRLIMTASNSSAWYYTETGTDEFKSTNAYFGESRNDKLQRVQEFAGNVWAFGRYSYDLFSWTGNRSNPYSSAKGLAGKIGLSAPDSLAFAGGNMLWVGGGLNGVDSVWMCAPGGQPTRVSNEDTDRIIGRWTNRSYARGYSLSVDGSEIYVLTSAADKYTMCYDVTNGVWFRAGETLEGRTVDWRISHPMQGYNGETLYLATDQNALCTLTDRCVAHSGNPITRMVQTPQQINGGDHFGMEALYPDFEMGLGESVSDSCQAYVQWSWNAAKSFDERKVIDLGIRGNYMAETGIFGGGMGRLLVIRIGTSDPVPVTLYAIRAEFSNG